MDMKEKIKGNLENLHKEYNQHIENYEENGEEDFNMWLDIFKEEEEEEKPNYKEAYFLLMTYWDSLPDEEKPQIDKELKKLGV